MNNRQYLEFIANFLEDGYHGRLVGKYDVLALVKELRTRASNYND